MVKYIAIIILLTTFSQIALSQCTIELGVDKQICEGESIELSSTNYEPDRWSTGALTRKITVSPTITTTYYAFATDIYGKSCSDEITVIVQPAPKINLGSDKYVCKNDTLLLESPRAEGYLWSDGSMENTLKVFPKETTKYWLTIADSRGCNNTDTLTVFVYSLPSVSAGSDVEICLGQTATLNATAGATAYLWNTGQKTGTINVSPSVTSDYQVTATDYNGCKNTAHVKVTVHTLPTAVFSIDYSCSNQAVVFRNNSKDNSYTISNSYWNFGDNQTSTQTAPQHKYATDGYYLVSLTVENTKGCKNTKTETIEVLQSPAAKIKSSATFSCGAPSTVKFTDISLYKTETLWQIQNQTFTDSDISYTFESEGDYTIKLTVKNNFGCTDVAEMNFAVYPVPNLEFTTNTLSGCEPLTVEFNYPAKETDNVLWRVENQNFTNPVLEPIFADEGSYSVGFQVKNQFGCTKSIVHDNYITVLKRPIANFDWNENSVPKPHGEIEFLNYTIDADVFKWDFGDTISVVEQAPIHKYRTNGEYIVKLTTENSNTGCIDTISKIVKVEYFQGLHVPNSFIPVYGDEDAAYFLPKGSQLIEFNIQIFNKIGNILWESNALENGSPSEGWNGYYKGTLQAQGVYIWKIDATFINGEEWQGVLDERGKYRKTGTLMLIR